jgi:hypothetical protein
MLKKCGCGKGLHVEKNGCGRLLDFERVRC